MTLPEIATACESAGPERQQELLVEAYATIHNQEPANDQWYGDTETKTRGRYFTAKLDAEAYLDAAMMLVPEGHSVDLTIGGYWPNRARLMPVYQEGSRWLHRGSDLHYTANASTSALALLAAICRALGSEG